MAGDIASVRASAARAAINPAHWPETLCRLSALVGADMTLFEHIDKATSTVEIGFTDRPDVIAATREPYESHFFAVNPRWHLGARMPVGAITHDDLIGDDKVLDGYEYYADFLRISGLKYYLASAAADNPRQTVILSLQRNIDRGRFDDAARGLFAAVLPDIRNAKAMYLRMARATGDAALAAVFDRLADPLAVLHEDGRIAFINKAMAALLAAGDVVAMRGDRLTGATATVERSLGSAMRHAIATRHSAMARADDGAAHAPWLLRVAPLERDDARAFAPGADRLFCLLIDDPARPRWGAVEDAMRLFGLTRREAMVAIETASGHSVDQIAGGLAVSRNTVRTHLAVVRDKLGVHSSLAVAAALHRTMPSFTV